LLQLWLPHLWAVGCRLFNEGQYISLDSDRNGMLSKKEFSRFQKSTLTPVLVDRLWQECRMYRNKNTGEMEMVLLTFLCSPYRFFAISETCTKYGYGNRTIKPFWIWYWH
jgi:hypothetical protein